MKQKITLGILVASAALAMPAAAATLLQTDFTAYADLTAAKADGWAQTFRNGRNTDLIVNGTNGLQSNGWKQSTLNHALSGSVDLSSDTIYTINYRQLTNAADSAAMFALTSATSSLVIGQSYNSDPGIYVGDAADNVLTSSTWYAFQTATGGTAEIGKDATARATYVGNGWTNFQIVIAASSAGTDSMTITATTDGGTTGDVINRNF